MTRFLDSRYAQLGAYLLIVAVSIFEFTSLQHASTLRVRDRKAQTLALCKVSVIDREALRNNAIATAELGVTLVNTPPLPTGSADIIRRAHAISVITKYRDSQLKILPALRCNANGTIVEVK